MWRFVGGDAWAAPMVTRSGVSFAQTPDTPLRANIGMHVAMHDPPSRWRSDTFCLRVAGCVYSPVRLV